MERCDSLKAADKAAPLHIYKLYMNPRVIRINRHRYTLGLLRHLPKDHVYYSPYINNVNLDGGAAYDMDQYGLKDPRCNEVLSPGDLKVESKEKINNMEDMTMEMLQFAMRDFIRPQGRMQVQQREDPESSSEDDEDEAEDLPAEGSDDEDDDPQEAQIRRILGDAYLPRARYSSSESEASESEDEPDIDPAVTDQLEAYTNPYSWREENEPAPYRFGIRFQRMNLDFRRDRETFHGIIEYLDYNKKMYDAMKYITEKLFGKRAHPIVIKTLELGDAGGVYRLPENFKVKVSNMRFGTEFGLLWDGLNSIFHESTLPFKSLHMPLEHDHPVIHATQRLVIGTEKMFGENFAWIPFLLKLPQKNVYMLHSPLFHHDYVQLIDNWIETPKSIGTCFTFGVKQYHATQSTLNLLGDHPMVVSKRMEGVDCTEFPHCFNIPLTYESELNVYGKKRTENLDPLEFMPHVSWCLVFEVMPIGSALPLED